METTIRKDKEIKEISLEDVVLIHNVRHAHLWHRPSYDPGSIHNYKIEDLVAMAITIVDNFLKGKAIFDNEPTVFLTEQGYEVQTGSTRAIVAKNLEIIINKNKAKFTDLYTPEELDKAALLEFGNFAQVFEKLSDAEKRRENNVRSDQHWLATAMGYYKDMKNGATLKSLAQKEGKSSAKIRDLVNLENLSGKAKTLCSKGVIGERVAIHLSKMPKVDQELVIDYIKEKEIAKISNPKHLMVALENSYTTLPTNYPMEAFEYKGKEFPAISKEDWYFMINDGSLFIRHLSRNKKKSDLRLDIYYQMKQDEIFAIYPEAKLIDKVKDSMVINDEVKCLNGKPYVVNGHTLKFGCSESSCTTHSFKIDQTVIKEELTQKLHEKEIQTTRATMFAQLASSVISNLTGTFTLMIIIMQLIFYKLSKKGKEHTLAHIRKTLSKSEIEHEISDFENVSDFKFSSLIGVSESFGKEEGFPCFTTANIETTISLMASFWLRDNPNLKFEQSLFNEFGIDMNSTDFPSQDVLDTVANTIAKKDTKAKSKTKQDKGILDTLVHILGVASYGLHKEFNTKGYLISRRHSYSYPQKAEMTCKKGVFELKFPNVDQEYLWNLTSLATNLGFSKTVVNNVTTQRRALNLINRRINELAPFIGEHWDDSHEKLCKARNEKYFNALAIRNFAINQFNINQNDLMNGIGSHSIASTIEEGINKNFEGCLTKPLTIEQKDEHFSLEEIIKKGKEISKVTFLNLADHWFPAASIFSCLDAKVEKEEWVKTGETDKDEIWKQIKKKEEEEKTKNATWMQQLCNSIDLFSQKAVSVISISDTDGSIAGVGHFFGQRAANYRVVYKCDNEEAINYFGQKDYEYLFANEQEDWDKYSALIVGSNNRIVTYDLIMASVSKCESNFTIAYAFDGGKMTQQPWWEDLVNNNPEFAHIDEQNSNAKNLDEVHSSIEYLNDAITGGVFMHLSEDGRKGMYLIDMDGQGYYAVINIDNEWSQSTDEEE